MLPAGSRNLAVVFLVLAASCAEAQQTPPLRVSEPQSITTASASASVPAPLPEAPRAIAAWTDPGAVAELAKDCRFAPALSIDGPGALSCAVQLEQSCNYDECDAVLEQCVPRCRETCEGCSGECVKGCESCKSACRDDACRRTCAVRCGACRQGCLREKDHCATGECAQEAATCSEKLRADYEHSPCPKLVPKLVSCTDTCVNALSNKPQDPTVYQRVFDCQTKCQRRVMPDCDRFFSLFRKY